MSDSQNVGFGFTVSTGVDASNFAVNQLPDVFGIVKGKLQLAANDSSFIAQVFGDKANTSEVQSIIGEWKIGVFGQLPSVQVISAADMNGADGAYASSTQKIYLSDSLFQSSAAPVDSVLGVAGVLTEETFHWLDDRVGADTQGDEGELAKGLLFRVKLSGSELVRIKSEDDRGFITLNGEKVLAEFAAYQMAAQENTDINGDGRADIVAFKNNGVYTSLSRVDGTFETARFAIGEYFTSTSSTGWKNNIEMPRMLADINGDGKADIVGFKNNGVYTSLSNGNGTFAAARFAIGEYFTSTSSTGWKNNIEMPRMLADINGDGKADIVGFKNNGVYTSLSNGNGTFAAARFAIGEYFTSTSSTGWKNNTEMPRMLADINGDGRADIVGFKNNGVYTSLSNGNGTFAAARFAIGEYFTSTSSTGWKNNTEMPRMLADINGDGRADIVGFKNNGVYTSLSNGNGTFAAARFAIGEYFTSTSSTGWKNNTEMPRMLADINGDGRADIVGFKNNGVYTSLSNGNGTFAAARFAIGEYFTSTSSTGWKNNIEMPRLISGSIFIPRDDAGNSLLTARNISVGSTQANIKEWVGSFDTQDYYKFTLTNKSKLDLRLNGLTADANLRLLDVNGNLIQVSEQVGTASESVIRDLNAGTYYIQVSPASGSNAIYNLSVSATPSLVTGLMTTSNNLTQLINGQLIGQYKDVDGSYGAQCWDLVAYATGINSSSKYWSTTNWKAGANVMSNGNVAVGTAIATFAGPNGKYNGGAYLHTAIFAGYDTVKGVSGFWVWDQNFDALLNGDLSIKKHFIRNNSSNQSDADNYFVINV